MKINRSILFLPVPFFLLSCKQDVTLQKPNILFILADDLGYYDLSYTGSTYYETPNIDSIAKDGIAFTNGYAAAQVSSPSRASIMTGKFPVRHGITDWIGAPSGEDWRKQERHNQLLPADYLHQLPATSTTLPEAMKLAGYKTFFAGKWHLGSRGSWPEDHGFDFNIGGWDAGSPRGGYFSPFDNPNLENRQDGENLSIRLAKETVNFLKMNHPAETGKPFFAFLSFYAVHAPIQTTEEKWKKYQHKATEMGIIPIGYKMGRFLPMRQVQDNPVYAGLIETMDDAVGLVLDALDELGLKKNTIVIFTSDNGGVSAGDAYSTSNLPLKGGKGYQFEGGLRVPYFIKVPGIVSSRSTCDVPVSGTDFFPTILELSGQSLSPDQHADGVSLVPLLTGNPIKKRPLIWHYPHYGNQGGEPSSIIRLDNWKLIYYYEDGHKELYNLATDLEEQYDMASLYPEKVEELHTKLFNYLNGTGARYPEKDVQYDSKLEETFLENIRNIKLPQLENQRLQYLSEDFNPGNNWWGSQTTRD